MIKENMVLQAFNQMGDGSYKQVKVSINSNIASAFKQACAASKTSMAATLSQFMAEFSNTTVTRKPLPDYSTRRQRRKAIQDIIKQLELIKDCEEQYRDRIPENLRESMVYDRADELIFVLDDAIDLLVAWMVP